MAKVGPAGMSAIDAEQRPVEPTDRSLLRRLRSGNQDAATKLYLRYVHRLRALARAKCSPDLASRLDAEDIVQSVFRSFFRGAKRGFYEVPDGDELWKLFLVIALNKIRAAGAFHRAAKRDVRLTQGGDSLHKPSTANSRPSDTPYVFLQMVFDEALAPLPPHQQAVIRLRLDGFEVAEIAARTSRSKRTVERILQEFRAQLRAILAEDE